jgi:hypothetical protein
MNRPRENSLTRREAIRSAGVLAGATLLAGVAGSENAFPQSKTDSDAGANSNEARIYPSLSPSLDRQTFWDCRVRYGS